MLLFIIPTDRRFGNYLELFQGDPSCEVTVMPRL